MQRLTIRGVTIGIGLLCLAGGAPAQTNSPLAESQTPSALYFTPIHAGASDPLQPVVYPAYSPDADTPVPIPSATPTTQPIGTLPEGMYLSHRGGQFAKSADGSAWQFIPDADPAVPGAAGTISLTVLPSQQFAAMEEAAKKAPPPPPTTAPIRFEVTGLVTNYKDQDYLLVDSVNIPNPDAAVLAADKVPPASQPASRLPPNEMLDQMLKPTANSTAHSLRPTSGPAADRTTGAAAIAPGAAALTVLREGTFLVDRTGRLTRAADGQTWEFSFDSDGRAMKDPPVVILPNLKLMAMEQATKGSNRDLRFRITGVVTEYNGRNYVLLEKVVVVPDSTQQF